jgi:O-6-methylguanine DNA methyltransferase
MARINDNLFTKLIEYAVPQEMGCRLLTRFGFVRANFSAQGLTALYFDENENIQAEGDSVFRSVFLEWIESYQNQSAKDQWTYLSPTGTDFQQTVWQALLTVDCAQTVSYSEIGRIIGKPKASRAVGSAVAANPIALLIPCHRIIRAEGGFGNYRWGSDRKQALLDAEAKAGSQLIDLFL